MFICAQLLHTAKPNCLSDARLVDWLPVFEVELVARTGVFAAPGTTFMTEGSFLPLCALNTGESIGGVLAIGTAENIFKNKFTFFRIYSDRYDEWACLVKSTSTYMIMLHDILVFM